MIYKKFNKYIYEHFFKSENFGETIIMAVDETVMKNFYDKFNFTEQCLIDDYKHTFIYSNFSFERKHKIPQFFGFVAIQIYVTYLMRNDKKQNNDKGYTEGAYIPRLAEFLQIEKNELYHYLKNYQKKAWKKIRTWGKKNGYILHIPKAKDLHRNRCYVPYPLSQALLNQEDLKQIPLLFQNAGLKPDEFLSFKTFIELINDSDSNIGLPIHYDSTKERLKKHDMEHLLFHQLFGYFNEKWDGTYPKEIERINRSQNRIEKNRTSLIINNEGTELSVIDQDFNYLFKCDLGENDLFYSIKKYYYTYHDEILIFARDKSHEEWTDSRFLETNQDYIIICKKDSSTASSIHNLDSNNIQTRFKHFLMFNVSLGEKRSKHFYWKPFFNPQPRNFEIGGGLKLSSKIWMVGAGPSITFFEKTGAWINGERIKLEDNNLEISCRDFEVGIYRLKVKDYPPVKIEIKEPNNISQKVHLGWTIDKMNAKWKIALDDYQITGLSTWFPKLQEEASVKTWIKALSSKPNKQKNSSVIINAIKRAKNGISK